MSTRFVSASALLIIIVAIAVSPAATAASKTATAAKGKNVTLHLVRKDVGFNFIDNPPRQGFNSPPLIGDQFAFTSNLFPTSGARTGTFDATCMVTRGGVNLRQACFGFYSLKGGQISGDGHGHEQQYDPTSRSSAAPASTRV